MRNNKEETRPFFSRIRVAHSTDRLIIDRSSVQLSKHRLITPMRMQRVAIPEEALLGTSRVIKSRALLLVPPNERPIHLAVNFPNNYTEYYLIQVMTTVARPNAITQQGRNRGMEGWRRT